MDISRRKFLQQAGLLGGAALGVSALPGCQWLVDWPVTQPLGTILSRPANQSPIDHVVVVMMENRSFDHYLGYLADDRSYLHNGRRRWGRDFHLNGMQDQSFIDPDGNLVSTAHLSEQVGQTNPWRGCGFEDPGHGWNSGRVQRDSGFLAAGSGNDQFALGYYDAGDLLFTEALARNSTVFDRYHASVLGPTYPNREYLHSAQSGGNKSNAFPTDANGFGWPLIWDKLAAANVPSRYYYSDLPLLALFGARGLSYSSPITEYYDGCANGTLPNVTMVDPNFFGVNQCDDHPLADVRAGQRFLRDAFKAFVESPHWEHGAFIVTYDEWGGFFDHVAPAHFPDDRRSANDADDFSQAGFRVPTVMASPYAKPGYVDHRAYDHTSILRFIEWRFLGAPPEGPVSPNPNWYLTLRDRNANNIGASLVPTIIDVEPGFNLDLPLDPPSAACGTEGTSLRALQSTSGDDAFDEDAWRTYLDGMGFALD